MRVGRVVRRGDEGRGKPIVRVGRVVRRGDEGRG